MALCCHTCVPRFFLSHWECWDFIWSANFLPCTLPCEGCPDTGFGSAAVPVLLWLSAQPKHDCIFLIKLPICCLRGAKWQAAWLHAYTREDRPRGWQVRHSCETHSSAVGKANGYDSSPACLKCLGSGEIVRLGYQELG